MLQGGRLLRQYLYFCASKASKLGACCCQFKLQEMCSQLHTCVEQEAAAAAEEEGEEAACARQVKKTKLSSPALLVQTLLHTCVEQEAVAGEGEDEEAACARAVLTLLALLVQKCRY